MRSYRFITPLALIFVLPFLMTPVARADVSAKKSLTIDDIYDPQKKINFRGSINYDLIWLDDSHYLWPKENAEKQTQWLKVDAQSGKTRPWFDAQKMERAFLALTGISSDDAKNVSQQKSFVLNDAKTAFVTTIADDLYFYEFGAKSAVKLTSVKGVEEFATFSPNGKSVAFVRDNNLFVVDLKDQVERKLTKDGGPMILNGKLDWIYQEEIYGRFDYKSFWWSPDSTHLAFLQLDENKVPNYTIIDDIPQEPKVEPYAYPKAGEPNPHARVGIVSALGGEVKWVDNTKYASLDHLIVNVAWAPDSKGVLYQVQDRIQSWLDLNRAGILDGSSKNLFRETSKAWVERPNDPYWLSDGSFLWRSGRSGRDHLYLYQGDGKLIRQITRGPFDVRLLYGVNNRRKIAYISASERSPIGDDVYQVNFDGSGFKRLSEKMGTHNAVFNKDSSMFLDYWSDAQTPTQLRLFSSTGRLLRVVDENVIAALNDFELSKPEFFQVRAKDGFMMEAMIIKPPHFDPAKKYPVFHQLYAGPTAQTVQNRWGGANGMFLQMLAQKGIIVWECDNRSASGKGPEAAWAVYREFGKSELSDIEDGIAWIKNQPFVDANRIGISGWSFGGYMVSYAMTHSKEFAMGIAGGTVADWHDYDSIYTERYMDTPHNNKEGYEKSSPLLAAKNLSGHILLIQGELDDNVHMQNTMQLAYEFQKAEKQFQLMIYPKSQHGVSEPLLTKHMRKLMLDFTMRNLRPGWPSGKAQSHSSSQH